MAWIPCVFLYVSVFTLDPITSKRQCILLLQLLAFNSKHTLKALCTGVQNTNPHKINSECNKIKVKGIKARPGP